MQPSKCTVNGEVVSLDAEGMIEEGRKANHRFKGKISEPLLDRIDLKVFLSPYDKEDGIHPQDDDFLDLEVWDFENTPSEKYPLLLFYHPLVIYRHQVIKQADIVLAMFLLGKEF